MTMVSYVNRFDEWAPGSSAVEGTSTEGWYLVQLKPGGLARASVNLDRLGFPVFMPRRPETRRQGGRLRTELRPLFPGYLFVRVVADNTRWRMINSTYGVARVVSLEPGRPTKVPGPIMHQMRAACGPDAILHPPAAPNVGDEVRVVSGPFVGALARIEAVPEGERVYLLLDMMSRKVRAAVSTRDLEIVGLGKCANRDKWSG